MADKHCVDKRYKWIALVKPFEALGFFESLDKISDYSGQIFTKNREMIVKNRFISYLQKIRFNSIIKKTRVLTQKFMDEKICGMTFNMYCHVFFIIFPNFLFKWKKLVRALRYPLFCLLGHALRRFWNPKPQLNASFTFYTIYYTKTSPDITNRRMY